jgi:hypothetical protein
MKKQALLKSTSLFVSLAICFAVGWAVDSTGAKSRRFRAKDVFDYRKAVIFQDSFQSGQFGKWRFSEDDRYNLPKETAARMKIVDAPGLGKGAKAVRFAVRRQPNSFRAEISLPHERGFNERWYGARMLVPAEWVFDSNRGNDIVMQWHAIPGNWRATYPNLEISIGNTNWFVRQSYGTAQTKPTRTNTILKDKVKPGKWVSWVVHAKWSPRADGILQIWKDGRLVINLKGANVYSSIGLEYTPYLKTGIYHPEWYLNSDRKRKAFKEEKAVAKNKVIFVTDVKVGRENATYKDVAPSSKTPPEKNAVN